VIVRNSKVRKEKVFISALRNTSILHVKLKGGMKMIEFEYTSKEVLFR